MFALQHKQGAGVRLEFYYRPNVTPLSDRARVCSLKMTQMFVFILSMCLIIGGAATPALSQVWWENGNGCDDDYRAGFAAGVGAGDAQGFERGFFEGAEACRAACAADPVSCGATLPAVLPPPGYGETEPNDNIVTADALPFDVNLWGQSYGAADEDWYYVVSTQPNQNLIVNLTVPNDGPVSGWKVAIRDAAGNLFADFDTAVSGPIAAPEGSVAYRVTLGLVGTYYIVVEPSPGTQNWWPYNIAAVLQDSDVTADNLIVGFFDTEIESNDEPGEATWLANGVTMYGLVNLNFNAAIPAGSDTRVWAQGQDWDYYYYVSPGSEIATITFCEREQCEAGDWFFEVYSLQEVDKLIKGQDAKPILAVNTDTAAQEPLKYNFGLQEPGLYYLRVNHRRSLNAPCARYAVDLDANGLPEDQSIGCSCESGDSCSVNVIQEENADLCVTAGSEGDSETTCYCPNGEAGEEVGAGLIRCAANCQCYDWRGEVIIPAGPISSQYNFTWTATHLPPNTVTTEAYQRFLQRPSAYQE